MQAAVIADGRGRQIVWSLVTQRQGTSAALAGHYFRAQMRRIVAAPPSGDAVVRPLIAPHTAENLQLVRIGIVVVAAYTAVWAAQPQLAAAHIVTAEQSPPAADRTPEPCLLPARSAPRAHVIRRQLVA